MSVFRCMYLQIAIALLLITQTTSTKAGSCIPSERSALFHFKAGLSDPAKISFRHGRAMTAAGGRASVAAIKPDML